jgi:hypothetical protein
MLCGSYVTSCTYLFPTRKLNLTRIVYPGPGKGQENIVPQAPWNSLPAAYCRRIEDSGSRFYMRFPGNFPAPVERCGSSLVLHGGGGPGRLRPASRQGRRVLRNCMVKPVIMIRLNGLFKAVWGKRRHQPFMPSPRRGGGYERESCGMRTRECNIR